MESMINYVPVILYDGSQKKIIGLFGLDSRGDMAYYGKSALIGMLDAFFRDSKELVRAERKENALVKTRINVNEAEKWLSEFRRQIPAPYFGGPLNTFVDNLEGLQNYMKDDGLEFKRY